ncbi:hypothetical protein B296_00033961 [Ensete ventricosum]|uniref:Uncharacterized protein n=1 Tax=Ensete ventricosum TaxID=4639 RepID=A0A426YLK5_ENSVE|nr:hypothetical protein B296_00033961 [Ensete ventricosum]
MQGDANKVEVSGDVDDEGKTKDNNQIVKSAKPVTLWYQSGTNTRKNTHHTNVGELAGLCGGQLARATVWGKRALRCRERSRSEERASKFDIQRYDQLLARKAPRGQLASDESLGHQHMGVVYHRGRSQIASISESHGGDLIIQRYDQSGWRVGLLQCLHSFKGAQQVRGQGRVSEVTIKEAKENRIDTSPATRWRRPCMRVAVCLSIDHGELLRGHNGVEVGGRKGRGSDDESGEAQLPKTQKTEDDQKKPTSPSLEKVEEKGIVVVHEAKCKVYVKVYL